MKNFFSISFDILKKNDEESDNDDDEENRYHRPNINIDDLKGQNQEKIKYMSKIGKPIMIIITISGNPTLEGKCIFIYNFFFFLIK